MALIKLAGCAIAGMMVIAATCSGRTNETTGTRQTLSLNGQWQIGQGELNEPPAEFPSTVVVPGLVDMARPAFADVGTSSAERNAFWYKRTFNLDGPVPPVAKLKIYKASFGSQVILNG